MLEKIKNKPKSQITREDIAKLLKSIGKPGEKLKEKQEAVAELGLKNFQGVKAEEWLDDYKEYDEPAT